jgi:hypothetical protein
VVAVVVKARFWRRVRRVRVGRGLWEGFGIDARVLSMGPMEER